MPRGRKKKYVRPKIECNCDVCGNDLEYPYVHISLQPYNYMLQKKVDKNEPKTPNKELDGAVVGYFCNEQCYAETL
tara:strand:- start:189 stop:416 length:228 start_codon:yes stop_codon:yes gene_type:complete